MTVQSTSAGLAEFLRARRAAVSPERIGVGAHARFGTRKVPGLRREELAEAAGVSLTYYTRLEQGTASNPSTQVLDSLARTLHLSTSERAHLHRLAAGTAPLAATDPQRRDEIATLLDRMPDIAAVALSPLQDIIAWNRLGHALLAPHLPADAPASKNPPNTVGMMFTDPKTRSLHREWEAEADLAVASWHYVAGAYATDEALARKVGELSLASADFARRWASQPVQMCTRGTKRFHHDRVGRLDLTFEVFLLPENDGHRLLLHYAQAGSADDDAIRLLASTSLTT